MIAKTALTILILIVMTACVGLCLIPLAVSDRNRPSAWAVCATAAVIPICAAIAGLAEMWGWP